MPRRKKLDFWPTPNAHPEARANKKLSPNWKPGWPKRWSPNLIDKVMEWEELRAEEQIEQAKIAEIERFLQAIIDGAKTTVQGGE